MIQTQKEKILSLLKSIADTVKLIKETMQYEVVNITNGILPTVAIDVLRKHYNTEIPLDYLEWLSICNGVSGRCIETIYGIDFINELLGLSPYWVSKEWFPIAGDGCGNYYVIARININSKMYYPVVFLDQEQSELEVCDRISYVVTSDFDIFLINFLEKIRFTLDVMFIKGYAENFEDEPPSFWWPFEREAVIQNDPNITLFNLPLPWDT
jgi:hypothetical protein